MDCYHFEMIFCSSFQALKEAWFNFSNIHFHEEFVFWVGVHFIWFWRSLRFFPCHNCLSARVCYSIILYGGFNMCWNTISPWIVWIINLGSAYFQRTWLSKAYLWVPLWWIENLTCYLDRGQWSPLCRLCQSPSLCRSLLNIMFYLLCFPWL